MASESSKEPVLASSPGTLQALIHEELRRVAKIVSRSTMEKLAGVRANFLYTAYIVKRTVTTPKIGSSTSRRREKLETNSATRKKANFTCWDNSSNKNNTSNVTTLRRDPYVGSRVGLPL